MSTLACRLYFGDNEDSKSLHLKRPEHVPRVGEVVVIAALSSRGGQMLIRRRKITRVEYHTLSQSRWFGMASAEIAVIRVFTEGDPEPE